MSPVEDTPLFPLGTVLYPDGLLPLRIFEARYIDMVSASLRDATPFGIVPITSGSEVGLPAEFHPFGTLATIAAWDQGRDGLLHIQVTGGDSFRVHAHRSGPDGLIRATISPTAAATDEVLPSEYRYMARLLEEVFEHNREQVPYEDWRLDSALWVGRRLAEVLPMSRADKIRVLEASSGRAVLGCVDAFLNSLETPPAPTSRH
jgi:uncharacterized protein